MQRHHKRIWGHFNVNLLFTEDFIQDCMAQWKRSNLEKHQFRILKSRKKFSEYLNLNCWFFTLNISAGLSGVAMAEGSASSDPMSLKPIWWHGSHESWYGQGCGIRVTRCEFIKFPVQSLRLSAIEVPVAVPHHQPPALPQQEVQPQVVPHLSPLLQLPSSSPFCLGLFSPCLCPPPPQHGRPPYTGRGWISYFHHQEMRRAPEVGAHFLLFQNSPLLDALLQAHSLAVPKIKCVTDQDEFLEWHLVIWPKEWIVGGSQVAGLQRYKRLRSIKESEKSDWSVTFSYTILHTVIPMAD